MNWRSKATEGHVVVVRVGRESCSLPCAPTGLFLLFVMVNIENYCKRLDHNNDHMYDTWLACGPSMHQRTFCCCCCSCTDIDDFSRLYLFLLCKVVVIMNSHDSKYVPMYDRACSRLLFFFNALNYCINYFTLID